MNIDNFETAFRMDGGGCREMCECGRQFYDASDNAWSWEDGEFEKLRDDPDATGVHYAVSRVEFEGHEYVADCDCWHPRAEKIMAFLDEHAAAIGKYFKLERDRIQAAANVIPLIEL